MNDERRDRWPDGAALPSRDGYPHDGEPEPVATADDERIERALAAGLGRLREPRPGFQAALEGDLIARLAEQQPAARPAEQTSVQAGQPSAARPAERPDSARFRWWWPGPARRPAGVRTGRRRVPRWSLVGAAAAAALTLAAASFVLPVAEPQSASAREILERAQERSENPVLAGIKSFHLTARIWTDPPGDRGPNEATTEQWFVAPDRLRTETRTQDRSGKPVISGTIVEGGEFRPYSTDGATDVMMVAVFAAPIGPKPPRPPDAPDAPERPRPPDAPEPPAPPSPGVPVSGVAVRTERHTTSEAGPADDGTSRQFVSARPAQVIVGAEGPAGSGMDNQDDRVVVVGENCPEPRRTGEASVAGRPVYVIEHDLSACLPGDSPVMLPSRHVRWVDQQTYLPLKLEMYDRTGKLVDRYEVQTIEYDVEIPAKTFTDLPPGTSQREPMKPIAFPPERVNVRPTRTPSSR